MATFGTTDRIDWVKKCSETIGITDTKAATVAFDRKKSEAIAITDSKISTSAFFKTISESITIADNKKITVAFVKPLSESISIADNKTVTISKLLSESIAGTDSIIKTFGKKITESIAIADSKTATVEFTRTLSESLTVTDNIAKTSTKLLTETIAIADAVVGTISGYVPLPDGYIEIETITVSGHTWTPGNIGATVNLHPHIQIECISGTVVNPTINDGNKTLSWTGTLTVGDILTLYPENKSEDKDRTPTTRADGQWIILKSGIVYTYTDETVGAFEVKVTINWEDDLYAREEFDELQTYDVRITPFSDLLEEDLK